MPDGGNHRDRAGGDGAHDDFLVERPQILDRTAAARDDHQIGPPVGGQGPKAGDRRRHLFGRALALHQHRPDRDMARKPVGQPVQNVADHRPGGRGDDADPPGQKGQRPLARRIEQPFGRELRLQPFEQLHQRARPGQFQPFDDDLIFGPARIGGQPPGRDHLDPVFGAKGEARHAAFPHHRVDHRLIVLQRQIGMARGRALEPADLAAQPHLAEPVLDHALQRLGKFGHAERRRVVAGLRLG